MLLPRGEAKLREPGIRRIADEFRKAMLNEDLQELGRLNEAYSPHYVHGIFPESRKPFVQTVWAFSQELVRESNLISSATKRFILDNIVSVWLAASVSLLSYGL